MLAYEMLVGFPPFVNQDGGKAAAAAAAAGPGAMPSGSAAVAAFLAQEATRRALRFPASVSAAARDFIIAALAERPGDRPSCGQLLRHPWLAGALKVGAGHGTCEWGIVELRV